jgi:hypothetical protein
MDDKKYDKLANGMSIIDSIKAQMSEGKTLDEAIQKEFPEINVKDERYEFFKSTIKEHLDNLKEDK